MKKKLIKYHVLNVLLFVGVFTIICPVLFSVFTGYGWAILFDLNKSENHPEAKRTVSNFFKPWY